jgi:hypothetical protein
MVMEELFGRGIMKMGPAKEDPNRQTGVFNMEFLMGLPALRQAEMEKFKWLAGEWNAWNNVPATRNNPAYTDVNSYAFSLCAKDCWICGVRNGRERPHITFDPFSRQWIYLLAEGAYGILRSPGWNGNEIVFTGQMTMIGIDCEWRQTMTKVSDDEYRAVNEERAGGWELGFCG